MITEKLMPGYDLWTNFEFRENQAPEVKLTSAIHMIVFLKNHRDYPPWNKQQVNTMGKWATSTKKKNSSSNHPFSGTFAVTFREGITFFSAENLQGIKKPPPHPLVPV